MIKVVMVMKNGDCLISEWRTKPIYTVSQAAKLAGTTYITAKRWLYGLQSESGNMKPVFGQKDRSGENKVEISFLQLSEIAVVSAFRKRNVRLESLRKAHLYARDRFGIPYPFASLKLKTDGAHVLIDFQGKNPGDKLLALDKLGQWALPGEVIKIIDEFEFDKEEIAARWYPQGKNIPIVIDPQFGAGQPTILKTRIPIELIYRRWKAGQQILYIARDYDIKRDIIESSLRYAESFA